MIPDLIKYCGELFGSLFSWSKLKTTCGVVLAILQFLIGENVHSFMIISILVILDLIIALIKISQTGEAFQSAKLRHTAVKWVVYGVLVSSAQFTETITRVPLIAQGILVILGATEMISILEHANAMGIVINFPLLKNIKKLRDK